MDDTEALKASSVSESIIWGTRAFQSFTVLGKKDIFLLSVLQVIIWKALWCCSLVVFLLAGWSLGSLLIATNLLSILNIMQRRASFLLLSRLLQFSLCSMSLTLEVFLCLFITYLAARRWTISSFCMLACVYGSHTVLAYSIKGLTRVK